MSKPDEFKEIAHSGGQVVIRTGRDKDGTRGYQLTWQHKRPVAAAIFAVYALPPGIAVAQMTLGGIGSVSNPPPVPGCLQVFIGSDSEGKFGHECPACQGYWRDEGGTLVCPYCGLRAQVHSFLTQAQHAYVAQYCAKMAEALGAEADGEYVIDMDAVADAAGKDQQKPPFYYAEESQQNKFNCAECHSFNDILGKFGYCSVCGTRNDLQELSEKTVPALRDRINSGGAYEACVKEAVAAFDSFVGQYVTELLRHIPLTPGRRNRLTERRFHNLGQVAAELRETFDIDIFDGIDAEGVSFAKLMFHRRHVYEHKGGEVDEKYIQDSGDNFVRPKQAIHETQESAHRIVAVVSKMAGNLHKGFHSILPADETVIKRYKRYRP